MEDPKPGVVTPPVTPGQAPGTPDPLKPGTPPAGVKSPEPGANTDPSKLLAALHEEREKNRELSARLEVQPPIGGQPQPAPTGKTIQQELDELWETDPRKAVQAEMMYGFNWYDGVNSALDTQRANLRAKYPDFNQYEAQAMNYVRTLPLNQRAMNGVVEAAYFLQKGQSSDSIYQSAMQEIIRKMQAGESIQGLPSGIPPVGGPLPGAKLNDQELAVAAAMGISPEDYMKNRK